MMATFQFLFVFLAFTSTTTLADHRTLSESIKFAVDFYKNTRDEISDNNIIISPLSVKTALGMVLMGSSGSTAEEIVRGLHLNTTDRSTIGSHFQNTLSPYIDGDVLKIANKVYAKTGVELNPQFNDFVRKQFNSEAENIDFSDSDNAKNNINAWVESKTNNKIKNLFSSGQLREDTKMVLVNAIAFKAAWDVPFDKHYTNTDDFWISENESVKVDMMYGNIGVKRGTIDELDAKILMVPYKDTDLSMMILLPNTRTGLTELENKIRTYDFSNILSNLRENDIDLFMPRFKIESSVKLNNVLKQMGMGTMFSDDADFRNLLNSGQHLKLDEAVHKAYITVDEDGTEAAAATGSTITDLILPPRVKVDHPFFFAIVGENSVPFVGTVRNF